MEEQAVIIRPATEEDCAAMLELVRELAVYERAPDEVTVSLAHFKQSGFGPQPVWWAFVAVCDAQITGFALYYIRYSTWKGQRMYLEDILVTEAWRGKGIGRLLMAALIAEARRRSLHGISWQVLSWNEPAIRFYAHYNARLDNEWINVAVDI